MFAGSSVNANTVTVKACHVEFSINLQETSTVKNFLIMTVISFRFGSFQRK